MKGHRDYTPEIGRWNSRDLIEEDGGLLLYGFVGNEPIGEIDVLGLAEARYIFEDRGDVECNTTL